MTPLQGEPHFPIEFLCRSAHLPRHGGRRGFRNNKSDFDDRPFGRTLQAHHALHTDRLHYWPFAPQWRDGQAGAPETASRLWPAGIGSPLEELNMSVLVHRKNASADTGLSSIVGFIRKIAMSAAKRFMHAMEIVSEAQMQKALIETELYRNRYKHSSKNDDDLPIVR